MQLALTDLWRVGGNYINPDEPRNSKQRGPWLRINTRTLQETILGPQTNEIIETQTHFHDILGNLVFLRNRFTGQV